MTRLPTMYKTALAVFALDQITKLIVVQWMNLKTVGVIPVVEPFLIFRMAWNTGINFGIGGGHGDYMRWVLIALALGISTWIVLWMRRDQPKPIVLVAAGLVVGGALGNVIDRIIYGAVADFLNMSCCGFESPWSFNVADIAIFVGAFGLILLSGDSAKDNDGTGKAG